MRDEPSRPLTVIYQSLREQIERGLLARGSKLPSERQLSELFSTTRITLREALGQLE
ncbi:GntR family transcriptional regulator, partial [Pseudomonas aeruginosa]